MNAPRRAGTRAETAVVTWLRGCGWPYVERRALCGSRDRGDVAGLVGVVVEVKAERRTDLAGWLAELTAEVTHDHADLGVVIVKRRGCTDPGSWYALTDAGTFAALLTAAGYGGTESLPARQRSTDGPGIPARTENTP